MRILFFFLISWSFSIFNLKVASAADFNDHVFENIAPIHAKSREFKGLNHRVWANNTVEWWYNANNQPFTTEQAVEAISNATLAWQNISGIKFVYKGITGQNLSNTADDKLVIGWLDAATFTKRFGHYSGYTAIWWLDAIVDSEVSLNLGDQRMTADINHFQAIMTHEFGHIIGLDHSNDSASIMYAPYHTFEYQMTLRTDDVNAARSLYPCGQCGDWYRVLNWAESNYPTLFKASNKQSKNVKTTSTRFYPETNSYLGYNTDGDYFYGANPAIWGEQTIKFGQLADYLSLAIQAGF